MTTTTLEEKDNTKIAKLFVNRIKKNINDIFKKSDFDYIEKSKKPEVTAETWTAKFIAEAIVTWWMRPQFHGDTCGECKARANVCVGPGHHCERCGSYNVHPLSCLNIPWKNPDFGPTQVTIRAARKHIIDYPLHGPHSLKKARFKNQYDKKWQITFETDSFPLRPSHSYTQIECNRQEAEEYLEHMKKNPHLIRQALRRNNMDLNYNRFYNRIYLEEVEYHHHDENVKIYYC